MRLGVITDEISQDFEHALDVMVEYKVVGAELRGLWDVNIADLSQDQINVAKELLASREISVVGLATPVYKCGLPGNVGDSGGMLHLAKERGFGEQMDLLRQCADIAHQFGTDQLRIFAFWPRQPLTSEVQDRIVDALSEAATVATSCDVNLVLENEHACIIGTGFEVASVVNRVNSPSLGICWDPGNSIMAGEKAFPDGYEFVRHFLKHVHVKDVKINPATGEKKWAVIGDGEIGYKSQFEALRKDGYTGWVSLETHYKPASGSAEEGSRLCLSALRGFIKD